MSQDQSPIGGGGHGHGHGRSGAGHLPVLPAQVLAALAPTPGSVYVDGTAGRGGHACLVAPKLGADGTVVLFDLDPGNLAAAGQAVRRVGDRGGGGPKVIEVHGSFAEAPHRLRSLGLVADMMLADLGFASNQVDDPSRGLSFRADGPLDMRLNPMAARTAADLVNTGSAGDLERIIREFGEERHARRVAAEIVRRRAERPIGTTAELAELVRSVVPPEYSQHGPGPRIDPATRTFQALRIAVNDELGHLEALLAAVGAGARAARSGGGAARGWLAPGARVAIIAFHSLEDRPVKRSLGELVRQGLAAEVGEAPTVADASEVAGNPRARSAKLRAVRFVGP